MLLRLVKIRFYDVPMTKFDPCIRENIKNYDIGALLQVWIETDLIPNYVP